MSSILFHSDMMQTKKLAVYCFRSLNMYSVLTSLSSKSVTLPCQSYTATTKTNTVKRKMEAFSTGTINSVTDEHKKEYSYIVL